MNIQNNLDLVFFLIGIINIQLFTLHALVFIACNYVLWVKLLGKNRKTDFNSIDLGGNRVLN